MASESENPSPVSPTMLRLETLVAVVLTCTAAGLSIFMPELIALGGIQAAQDVTTLSPIFFPRLAFGLLSLLCLSYLGKSVRQMLSGPFGIPAGADQFTRAVIMMIVAAIYAYFVTELGYGLATLLMTAAVAIYLGLHQWWIVVSVSFLSPIVIRFIFERLLLISLPRSEIEIVGNIEDGIMKFLSGILLGGW